MTKKIEFQTKRKMLKESNSSRVKKKNYPEVTTDKGFKVMVADLVGMKFDHNGNPDSSEVRDYIKEKGGVFHLGPIDKDYVLEAGKIHFFYQPDLSRIEEILP